MPDANDRLRAGALKNPAQGTPITLPDDTPEGMDIERYHVRRGVEELIARVHRLQSGGGAWFPLPGGLEGPPDTRGPREYPERTLRVGPADLRYRWEALHHLTGSWRPDILTVLVAGTGMGKTSWAVQVAEEVARAEHPVLYASAELGADELVARLLGLRGFAHDEPERPGGVAWSAILTGRVHLGDIEEAGEALVNDCPHLYLWTPTIDDLKTPDAAFLDAVQALYNRHRTAPFIVVDYIQRFALSGPEVRQNVRDLSGALRLICRPGPAAGFGDDWPGAAVLALSSAPRGAYKVLGDTEKLRKTWEGSRWELVGAGKESGELEFDAATVLVMAVDGKGAPPYRGLLAVAKNRYGPQGLLGMDFHAPQGVFHVYPATAETSPKGKTDERPPMG